MRGIDECRDVKAGDRDDALQVFSGGKAARGDGEQASAIADDPLGDLFTGFADDDLFSIDKGEHGIGRSFGSLDQVAIENDWNAVESSEVDHGVECPLRGLSAGGGKG